MRRTKFAVTAILMALMLGIMAFSVFSYLNKSKFVSPPRKIKYEVAQGVFFDAKFSYSWTDAEILFGVDTATGTISEEKVTEKDGVFTLKEAQPELAFGADTSVVYTSTYSFTNTGENDIEIVVSGIAFDPTAQTIFSTTCSFMGHENVVITEGLSLDGLQMGEGAFAVTILLKSDEQKEVKVSRKLERLNESVEFSESLAFTFALAGGENA